MTTATAYTPEQIDAASVPCRICGHESLFLSDHLSESHDLTVEAYLRENPGAPTVSDLLLEAEEALRPKATRRSAKHLDDLAVPIAGLDVSVWHEVPSEVCLPLPPNYRMPRYGKLGKQVARCTEYLVSGRHSWVSGAPGTGKDANIHAFSALCRRPAFMLTIDPNLDLEPAMYTRSFGPDGEGGTRTFWEFGALWKALTEGYVAPSGKVYPYIILLSDFDRATKAQVEKLRLICDSISGRVMGPDGKTVPVIPGTTIVATANSQGGGDTTGRCISSRPVDSSIMDRFKRKVIFTAMSWKDEGPILQAKFPVLFDRVPEAYDTLGNATKALRKSIEAGDLYCEFTHRTLSDWCEASEDRMALRPKSKLATLLADCSDVWVDGLADEETRLEARRIIDPYLKGGVFEGSGAEDEDQLVEGF
jgi:hypothetical protein